jgi:hypothetical protein
LNHQDHTHGLPWFIVTATATSIERQERKNKNKSKDITHLLNKEASIFTAKLNQQATKIRPETKIFQVMLMINHRQV